MIMLNNDQPARLRWDNTQPDPLQWRPTVAVVTACKRTWNTSLVDESSLDSEGFYQSATFRITFSYEIEGKTYSGKYKSGSPVEIGHSFEILYDPQDPAGNTGADVVPGRLVRVSACILAIGLVLLLVRVFSQFSE